MLVKLTFCNSQLLQCMAFFIQFYPLDTVQFTFLTIGPAIPSCILFAFIPQCRRYCFLFSTFNCLFFLAFSSGLHFSFFIQKLSSGLGS